MRVEDGEAVGKALRIAANLVAAYVSKKSVRPDEIVPLLTGVYAVVRNAAGEDVHRHHEAALTRRKMKRQSS